MHVFPDLSKDVGKAGASRYTAPTALGQWVQTVAKKTFLMQAKKEEEERTKKRKEGKSERRETNKGCFKRDA